MYKNILFALSIGASLCSLGSFSATTNVSPASSPTANQGSIDIGGKGGVILNGKDRSITIGGGAVKLDETGIHIGNTPNDQHQSPENSAKNVANLKSSVTKHYKNGKSKGFGGVGNFNLKNMTISQETNIVGSLYAKNSTFNGVGVVGPATFDDVTIKQEADITGPATFNDVTINKNADITGPAHLKDTTVNSVFAGIGPVSAIDSTFNNKVAVTGGPVYFNHTKAKTIAITSQGQPVQHTKKQKPTSVTPDITLANHSVVQNITFSSGNGIVLVEGHSKITGKVSGGRIVHQKG